MQKVKLILISYLCVFFYGIESNAQDNLIRDTVYFNQETGNMRINIPAPSILEKSSFSQKYKLDCIVQKSKDKDNQIKITLDNGCEKPTKLPYILLELEFKYKATSYIAEIYCIYKDVSITQLQIMYGGEYNLCNLSKKLNQLNLESAESIKSKEELVVAKEMQKTTLDEIKDNQEKIKELEEKNKRIDKDRIAKEEKEKEAAKQVEKEREKERAEKEKKIELAEKKRKQADEEVSTLNKQVSDLNAKIEELKKENERIGKNKEEKSKKERRRIEEENAVNDKRLDSMKMNMQSLNSKIGMEEQKRTQYVSEINSLKDENQTLLKDNQSLKAQLEGQKIENEQLATQLNALKLQTEKLLEDYNRKEEYISIAAKKFSITDDEDIKKAEGKIKDKSELRELPMGYEGQFMEKEFSEKVKYLLSLGAEDTTLSSYSIEQDCMKLTLVNIYFDEDASFFRFRIENACPYQFQTGKTLLKGEYANGQRGAYNKILPKYMNFPILFEKRGGKSSVKDIIYVAPQKLFMHDESDLYIKISDRTAKWNIELGFPFGIYLNKLDQNTK